MKEYEDGLSSTDRRELLQESAIAPEVAYARGYRTIGRPSVNDRSNVAMLQAKNIPGWAINEDRLFPGILIPLYGPDGRLRSHQWKPRTPAVTRDGKRMKYASAKGTGSILDVHPRWTKADAGIVPPIKDASLPLFITEGIKKADSLTSRDAVTIGLNGVWNWRSPLGALGDWEDVALKGRDVYIVYDADAVTNRMVGQAGTRLGNWLRSKGARPKFIIPPAARGGKDTKGVDDWFAAGGTLDELLALAAPSMPYNSADDDSFTDARLAARYAEDVLSGRFIYIEGIEWMAWDGKRWKAVPPAIPIDAVREYAIERYADAHRDIMTLVAQRKPTDDAETCAKGWRNAQAAGRLKAAFELAKGIPELRRELHEMDADPDLLNTPCGIVDLRTGETRPHDPGALMSRITAVAYRPGAVDDAFTAILQSVPHDAEGWLRTQFGQAVTGYAGSTLTMLDGGGRNGKTKLMGVLTDALGASLPGGGGYASMVSNTMLLTVHEKAGPSPEKMELLGLRLAYMEETPVDGVLNANMLKEVVDAHSITARPLYHKQVTFRPTHTLFLATNHPPQVNGTDTAVWRRLRRVTFPYRFRTADDGLGAWAEGDKDGIADIERQLRSKGAREAALAWLVAGAVASYGEPAAVPSSIAESVTAWREDTDDVAAFFLDHLEPSFGSWVNASDVYEVFAAWQKARGARVPMGYKVFIGRSTSHTGLQSKVDKTRIRMSRDGFSKRPNSHPADSLPTVQNSSTYGFAGWRWKTPGY